MVADRIRRRLFEFDEAQRQADEEDLLEQDDSLVDVIDRPISTSNVFHVKLGSRQHSQTFDAIEEAHRDDQAFGNFRVKLNNFLNLLLPSSNIPLPEGKHIHLRGTYEVCSSRLFVFAMLTCTRRLQSIVSFVSTTNQWLIGASTQTTFIATPFSLVPRASTASLFGRQKTRSFSAG